MPYSYSHFSIQGCGSVEVVLQSGPNLTTGIYYPRPILAELNLLPTNQRLLQCTPDPYRVHGPLELHGRRCIVQTARREFIRLVDERVPEPSVVMRRDLASDTGGFVNVDQVCLWLGVDCQFSFCACDFGGCGTEQTRQKSVIDATKEGRGRFDRSNGRGRRGG